uniref:BTB domain-containing protein n=1 Tax=Syphacia muris TaxID=451379 RepID=A0A158R439_9BILA
MDSREHFCGARENSINCDNEIEMKEATPIMLTKIDYTNSNDAYLRLNVGGRSFIIRKNTVANRDAGKCLLSLDSCLLNILLRTTHEERLKIVDGYFEETNEYFFERSPNHFTVIYQYYLNGIVHQNADVCPEDLLDELKFWQIPLDNIAENCICTMDTTENEEGETIEDSECYTNDNNDKTFYQKLKRKLWRLTEDPNSSKYAQAFAAISVLFVLISISGLVLGSIPELQVPSQRKNATGYATEAIMEPHPMFSTIEYVCILWFVFEYLLKLSVSYDRKKTFLKLLNIIDLLAILPFVIEFAFILVGVSTAEMQDWKGAFLVIRILRVLRVIRVLKLGRYSSGLQLFGKTLKASFRQLGMMAMVVFTGVIFFGTLMYFIEKDEPSTQFVTIPAGCYGDITPLTVSGKLVATVAIACGVLVLALPITIIVDNFMKVAETERTQEPIRTYGRARVAK